ncbi:hypothetical protein PENCOP_c001G08251 [Penicillium coprophilum]|uniref:Uncharacterized protein n=1 Tax=Penicillium coprophilum TaxID=36646 RepID=A0A1V6V6A6_9EURO|nr:hypothetical protein PENCOP_c001G08251 [Penicillium coprophilum]
MVLPKSPTSIAAVACFLYGSRMLSSAIKNGSEWCSDEEMKKRGVFEGRSLSMGWWEVERQRSRSQSDVSSVSRISEERFSGESVSEEETQPRAASRGDQNSPDEQNGHNQTRLGIDIDIADRPLLRNASPI